MITGKCELAVYYCPKCGIIHSGEALGGVHKKCKPCSFYGMCDAREKVNRGKLRIYESLCDNCLLEVARNLTEWGGK